MPDLVQDSGFLQGEGAVQQLRFDQAEFSCVEAVEGADRRDFFVGIDLGHGAPRYLLLSNNYLTLASIFTWAGEFLLCMGLFCEFESGAF
jgi:hypothetical protein